MKNGQLKATYNVPMATENQFISFYTMLQRLTANQYTLFYSTLRETRRFGIVALTHNFLKVTGIAQPLSREKINKGELKLSLFFTCINLGTY